MAHDHELQEFLHLRMMVLEVKQQLLNGDLANPKPTRVLAKQDQCAAGHACDVEGQDRAWMLLVELDGIAEALEKRQ